MKFEIKRGILFSFFAAAVGAWSVPGASVDSTNLLFNDSIIRHYELQFYFDHWKDSLEYYKSLSSEPYIPAKFICRDASGDSIVLDSIGVRYKGNSTYNFAGSSPKKPYKFRFDKYRNKQTFFGEEYLNFSNGAQDPSQMREKLSYDLIRKYIPAPRASYATITTEGQLLGLYTQVEQVDKLFLSRYFKKPDYNLYKAGDNGASLLYTGQNQTNYEAEMSLKTNTSTNDWSGLIDLIDKLNNTSDANFVSVMKTRLDLDIVARYLAGNMVISNFDSYTGSGRNFYLYDDQDSKKFKLIPWDYNLSIGDYTNNWNVSTVDIINISNLDQRPLNKRILAIDSLRQVYLRYIRNMIDGPASVDSIVAEAARLKTIIDSTVQMDSLKLHSYADFVKNMNDDVLLQQGSIRIVMPGLKSFMTKRIAALRTQLDTYLPVLNKKVVKYNRQALQCVWRASDPVMRVRYTIQSPSSAVKLTLMRSDGRIIRSKVYATNAPGSYECVWNTRGLSAGCYLLQLTTSTGSATLRIMALNHG